MSRRKGEPQTMLLKARKRKKDFRFSLQDGAKNRKGGEPITTSHSLGNYSPSVRGGGEKKRV